MLRDGIELEKQDETLNPLEKINLPKKTGKINYKLPQFYTKAEKQLQQYIIVSIQPKMPALLPFAFDNKSILEVAQYLLRYKSKSKGTLLNYVYTIHRFSKWTNMQPDQMIQQCKDQDGDPDFKAISKFNKLLDDYIGELQAQDMTPLGIQGQLKGVLALFRNNGAKLELKHKLPNRTTYKIRSPKPENLQKMIVESKIREKVIIAMFATGGFRLETLTLLKYRHIKEDFENGIIPLHIHVEAEITKGKYHDYDTFLGPEAVKYLKLYFEQRRQGTKIIPPEIIHDETPIIRNERQRRVQPISPVAVYSVIHGLYRKADLISKKLVGKRYGLCIHSIRKYFKTQLTALNVQADYIEYMMGHTISTYDDIDMKGIEFLRGIYATAGLNIEPKTRVSKIDALKEIIRAWGLNPEELLTKDALAKGNQTCIERQEQVENNQIRQLTSALKEQMVKSIREDKNELQ
jgi:hypothetical protein